jgi:NTP pyrophosphatase (non-canonical NTP hydrolase)
MNLPQYIQAALETESVIPNVTTDVDNLQAVLSSVIAAGNLLDVIKKDTFYGLPKDEDKLAKRLIRLEDNAILLRRAAGHTEALTRRKIRGDETSVRTLNNINPRVAHAIIGLATEAVELLEALYEAVETGTEMDGVNILEELGDLNWYHAIAVDALGGSWEQIQETNIAKLRNRNKGKKFNADATINRDVGAERALLEQQLVPADARAVADYNSVGGSDF